MNGEADSGADLPANQEVTRLLAALARKDAALADLVPLVYDELLLLARRRIGKERDGHTLSATALVHEAYLKLADNRALEWKSRRHFFAAAGEAMRRVLVDHARRVRSQKRGGGRERLTFSLSDLVGAEDDPSRLLALNEALDELARTDARAAEVARLRLFVGLEPTDIARVLDLSQRTAEREWTYARTRLAERLSRGEDARTDHGDGAPPDRGSLP